VRSLLHKKGAMLLGIGLIAPCLIYFGVLFFWPIATMLYKGVHSPEVAIGLPRTAEAIVSWETSELPSDAIFVALGQDLAEQGQNVAYARAVAARRLNYEVPGYRTLVLKSARLASKLEQSPRREEILKFDRRWGDVAYWHAMKRAARTFTPYYILTALDLEEKDDGSIAGVPANRALFLNILGRTFWIAGVVTAICLVIAFPVAHQIATASPKLRSILLMLVLLPFWTSLLVRTSAWVVLLQPKGLINSALMDIGLIEQPFELIFNRTGVYISFVHVLLPFVVLPLYSVMSGVSKDYVRAAYSMGASVPRTFFKIYLPLVWPGAMAGGLLCFVVSIGYYITPLLVGGTKDQMLSYFIAFFTNQTVNWGLASALAMLLSVSVLVLLLIYGRSSRGTSLVVNR